MLFTLPACDDGGFGRLDATILLSLTVLLAVGAALNSPAWAASVPLTVELGKLGRRGPRGAASVAVPDGVAPRPWRGF